MSFSKAPSVIRGDSGLLATGRFSRTYCKHCKGEELHQSMVCVQCGKGGLPVSRIETRWNGKRVGSV